MTESHKNPDISVEASESIDEVEKEVASALDGTPDTTKGSEQQQPAVTDAVQNMGQSTNEPINGDEGKLSGTGAPTTESEGKEKESEGGEVAGEVPVGEDHEGDTTKEGKPAQTGEKRTHPEDTPDEKKEGGDDSAEVGAKKLKTDDTHTQADESRSDEEEASATKGKGGRRKSTRKGTTAAAAAKTSTTGTDSKKKPVGRPRKNAAPAQAEDKKDDSAEKMETVPVG